MYIQNYLLSFRLKKYSFLALVLFFLLCLYDVASGTTCVSDTDCLPTETCDKNTTPYTCHLSSYKCDTATKTCVKVALYTGKGLKDCQQSCESHGCINNSECQSYRAPHRTCTSAGACAPAINIAGSKIIIKNSTGSSNTFYFRVMSRSIASDIQHLIQKPSTCTVDVDVNNIQHTTCTAEFTLPNPGSIPIAYNLGNLILPVTITSSAGPKHLPQGTCNTTLAEITMNKAADAYDISLVNGRNYNMEIINDKDTSKAISLHDSDDSKSTLGVYPIGCSRCVDSIGAAPNWTAKGGTTKDCLGTRLNGAPPATQKPLPPGYCKTGPEFNANPNKCEIDSIPTEGNYTITFLPCTNPDCL